MADWPEILGAAAKTLGVLPTLPLPPEFQNPGVFVDVFAQTLDFSVFPRKSRHALSVNLGTTTRAHGHGLMTRFDRAFKARNCSMETLWLPLAGLAISQDRRLQITPQFRTHHGDAALWDAKYRA